MKKLFILATALLMSFTLQATEVAGVSINDTLTLDKKTLTLNGAGVRSKFLMNLYVGSLYTKDKTSNADNVINSKTPVAIQLDIISSMITSDKMTSTLNDGFNTATKGNVQPFRERLDSFIGVFKEKIVKGDQFVMMIVPGKGLDAYKNGKLLTTVSGDDFSKTLLGIWLGDKPADKKLKKAMLDG